jgi:eukaryotic-like serine/threonine-protein kinase
MERKTMPVTSTCPTCGTALPSDAPKGFCPRCLYRLGFGLELEDGSRRTEDRGQVTAGASLIPNRKSEIVKPFGDYELLEEIGYGGMGVVYKAWQKSLDRIVALKVLLFGPHASAKSVKRFRAEAVATAALQHPNIVAIHEVGFREGQHFIAMEFIEGQPLSALIRGNPLPDRRAAGYVKAIAEAIHYAHERGILHRDLKPANVLIDTNDQPRVTDFGLAKRLEGDSDLTVSGQLLGSPNYMPPEQAIGKRGTLSRRSDVYALGAILYHALTGRPPFVGEGMADTVQQVLNAEPVSPRLLNPGVPRDLETVCLKCLEKEPGKRYATAQILADELGCFLEDKPVHARPVSRPAKVWRWYRRNPLLATALGVALLSLLAGVAGMAWQWRRATAGEWLARQMEYAAAISMAQRAVYNDEIARATSLLDRYRPAAGASLDLRGWEWRYLWQLSQGDESSVLHRCSEGMNALTVSKDGRLMALATDARVELWDLAARRPIADLPEKGETVALSPAADLLAVGTSNAGGEAGINLWDVASRKLLRRLKNQAGVSSLAFSPEGQLLAALFRSGSVQVMELASGQVLDRHSIGVVRRACAGVVVFSPDGRQLAIGGDRGQIELLDWRSQTVAPLKTVTPEGVYALAFSPSGHTLAAGFGYTGGRIILWDLTSAEVRGQWTNHTTDLRGLAFTPDGRKLVWADRDRTIGVWDLASGAEPRYLRTGRRGLMALALLPDGRTLVSGSAEGDVCLWDLQAPERPPAHSQLAVSYGAKDQGELPPGSFDKPDPRAVRRLGVAFTPNSRRFVTTDPEGALGIYDALSMQLLEPLPAFGSNNWGVAFSPDGRWLAAGSAAGNVVVWDFPARRPVATFTVPFEWFGWLQFSQRGRFLSACTGFNNRSMLVRLWQTCDWTELLAKEVRSPPTLGVPDFSPEERLIWVGTSDGVVQGLTLPTGGTVATWHTGFTPFNFLRSSSYFLRCSPDGRLLASTALRGSIRLWDATGSRELPSFLSHKPYAYSLAFSADGRRLASGGDKPNDAVKFWDLATQSELLSLPAEGSSYLNVGFSPDGNTLFAVNFSGLAHFWRAPSWEEIEAVERRTGNQSGAATK